MNFHYYHHLHHSKELDLQKFVLHHHNRRLASKMYPLVVNPKCSENLTILSLHKWIN